MMFLFYLNFISSNFYILSNPIHAVLITGIESTMFSSCFIDVCYLNKVSKVTSLTVVLQWCTEVTINHLLCLVSYTSCYSLKHKQDCLWTCHLRQQRSHLHISPQSSPPSQNQSNKDNFADFVIPQTRNVKVSNPYEYTHYHVTSKLGQAFKSWIW